MTKHALVIGGGPAGLMAATELLARGMSVQITDAKPTLCRKFLMAGKSGLNLTKNEPLDACIAQYDSAELIPMLREFGPADVMAWADALGADTYTGSTGRVFPRVGKASPLLRAWIAQLTEQGLDIRTNHRLRRIDGLRFTFDTPDGPSDIIADVTVLALGGGSWAKLGSDGTWPAFFAPGLTKAFQPSNCGFDVDWSPHMGKFFGQPVKSIAMTAGQYTSRGEITLTPQGIEGGGIYPLSPALRNGERLVIDLKPDMSVADVLAAVSRPRGKNSLSNHLRKSLRLDPVKIALIREFTGGISLHPEILAQTIKSLSLPPLRPHPLDQAISTAGGMRWDALNGTLMIRDYPGVFCAGEMIDWDAPTGGYLLTACFATGRWAGINAARWVQADGSQ